MYKLISVLMLGLLATPPVDSKPAVFRDSLLLIDDAVTIGSEAPRYFKNVQLQVLPSGQLVLLQADPRMLVQVQDFSVAVLHTEPAQVELLVAGVLGDPCVQLEPVAVSFSGNTFHVVIAETAPDPAATCLAQVVPYEVTVPLDIRDLSPGKYHVTVNGDTIDFDLE